MSKLKVEHQAVQDLALHPKVTRYRRERWQTPDGETILADLDSGIVGGYCPNLHRLVLMLHFAGQMICERIVALLNGIGVVISKRQVLRLLTARLDTFQAEGEAVLKAALTEAPFNTIDDTGAPRGQERFLDADRFTAFRTGPSKSRQAFLAQLCGATVLYAINGAALDTMRARNLQQAAIDALMHHDVMNISPDTKKARRLRWGTRRSWLRLVEKISAIESSA